MLPHAATLAKFCDVFCEPRVFPVDDARRVLAGGEEPADSGCACTPISWKTAAARSSRRSWGRRRRIIWSIPTRPGIGALSELGVQPVLLPGAVYALGSRQYPDARAMIAAGLGIVLATDFNPGSSPTPSMPMILSLAATQMKMTPAESITASTINAAYSLGLGGGDRVARGRQARRFRDSRLRGSSRARRIFSESRRRAKYTSAGGAYTRKHAA